MKLQRYTLYLVGSIILANYTFGIFTVSADNLSTVQTRVNQIQATDPLLPSGVTEQKGMFGTIIAALFDTAGKIRVEFLGNLVPGITSNNVPKWNGTNFVNSSISDDGTNINLTRSLITNSSMKINGWLPLYFQGTSLYGQDNGLYFYSDHPNSTFMRFYDRNGVRYGAVYGGGTGAYFGIEDGDGDRSYLAAKNSYTDFRINNSSIMRFLYPSGNVGIGTTSPSYRLDVAGTIHTNGDLMANRICNADGSSCNTFPLATGGGYWTVSGNNIYNNNSGNVGIGNSSPNAKLDVAGGVIANAVSTTCIGNCSVATAATAPALSGNYGVNGDMYVTGNFGVGTSTPSYKMEVTGSLKANNYVWKNGVNWSMPDDNSEMSFDFANASGNAYWHVRDPTHGTILSARNNGNVGVGTASPGLRMEIISTDSYGHSLRLRNGTSLTPWTDFIKRSSSYASPNAFTISNNDGTNWYHGLTVAGNGNVGIGTESPSHKLEVYSSSDWLTAKFDSPGPRTVIKMRAGNTSVNTKGLYLHYGGTAVGDNNQLRFGGASLADTNMGRSGPNSVTFDMDAAGDTLFVAGSSNVGIGTASPSQKLSIQDGGLTIRSTAPTIYLRDTDQYSGMIHMNSNLMYFLRGCGYDTESWCVTGYDWPLYLNMTDNNAVFGGEVQAYGFGNRSDIRLKKDIVTLEDDNIKKLLDLRPVSYKWKEEYSTDKNTRLGFIAQEVEKIYPSIISSSKNAKGEDIKSIYYTDLIAPLVKGFQVHNSEIEELKKQNMELQQEVEDLKRTMSR